MEAETFAAILKGATPDTSVVHFVRTLCAEFKKIVEDNQAARLLWDGTTPKAEKFVQDLFHSVVRLSCKKSDIGISPEVDSGRGPVDFKFNRGYESVLVEIKLSTNSNIKHGFTTQTIKYVKAEESQYAVVVVVDYLDKKDVRSKLEAAQQTIVDKGERSPELVWVDGRKKVSASKYHPEEE